MPIASETWFGVPEGVGAATTGDGTRNRNPCDSRRLHDIGKALNHLAACGRCVFSVSLVDVADSPNVVPNTVEWHFCYEHRNDNGQGLRILAVYAPIDTVAIVGTNPAVLRIRDETAAINYDVLRAANREPGINWPDSLIAGEAFIGPFVPDGILHSYTVRTIDGFRLMGLCVWEMKSLIRPGDPAVLGGTDEFVETSAFAAVAPVESDNAAGDAIVQLRTVEHSQFHGNRDVYAYSMPVGSTGTTYLSTAAVVPTNLVDGSVARTANTWGMPVASLSGGYGLRTQVEGTCRVLAECTLGHTGYVDFVSSLGTATSGAITVLGWYDVTIGGTGKVPLDSTANDKVDLQGYLAAAPPPGAELRVYAWHVDIDPD